MYDVGKIRKAALAIYDVRPGPVSVLVLIRSAQETLRGLMERRVDLPALIAYQPGTKQWDLDAKRYADWLAEAEVVAEKIQAGAPTPLWAEKYANVLRELFLGGLRARAAYWATLSNQMDALEGADRDMAEQTSWLIKWWAAPAATIAANLAVAYDLQETKEDFAKFSDSVQAQAKIFIKQGAGILGIAAIGAAIYFGWPFLGPLLLGAKKGARE